MGKLKEGQLDIVLQQANQVAVQLKNAPKIDQLKRAHEHCTMIGMQRSDYVEHPGGAGRGRIRQCAASGALPPPQRCVTNVRLRGFGMLLNI